MTLENFHYLVGGILGCCGIFTAVISAGSRIWFPRVEGLLLAQKLDHIEASVNEIRSAVLKPES